MTIVRAAFYEILRGAKCQWPTASAPSAPQKFHEALWKGLALRIEWMLLKSRTNRVEVDDSSSSSTL
eukprot:8117-Heterococcus_DN1.PRE.9